MKIAIDARFLGPEGTGIGKYIEKLLDGLQTLDKENEYLVFLKRTNFHLFDPKNPNFKKILADANWYSLKEQILLPAILTKLKPDLAHFPHFNVPLLYPGKFVVTIHDITKSEFKSTDSTTHSKPVFFLKHTGYEIALNQAVKKAEKILVPSISVKKKLIATFGLRQEKIVPIYEAADEIFSHAAKSKISKVRRRHLLEKYGIKDPFIIYVGNAYPYKNLQVVFESLKVLEKKVGFVHVTRRGFFSDRMVEAVFSHEYLSTCFNPFLTNSVFKL